MKQSSDKSAKFKVIIVWLAILLMGSFWLSMQESSSPVSMVVLPEVPREGEPIVVTFKLNNPSSHPLPTRYQFYANGWLLQEKVTTIAAESSKTYQYAYANPLQIGEQLNFVVRTQSRLGDHEKVVASPPYPPQVWSSFVSFAAFSTSVMSSMASVTYYQSTFGGDMGLNVGIITSVVLIILLIFLELTRPVTGGRAARLERLRIRLSAVTWILLIIFMGIAYARVVMLLAT